MTDHISDPPPVPSIGSPQGASAKSPQVLKCSGTADFLAALPQLAGFTATHSLFVLFFEGSRTCEAMRVDLPPNDDPRETADLLEFLSHAIRSFSLNNGRTSAPAIAIMSAQSFAECGGPPWLRLARRIERRLRRDHIYPRELCVRAPDGWVSYLDATAPRGGRSLDDIEQSPIAVAARLARQQVPTLTELGALPPADPDRMARTATELAVLEQAARARVALAPVASRTLCDTQASLTPESVGQIAHVAGTAQGWWHLAMGVITRPEFLGELEQEFGEHLLGKLPVAASASAPLSMASILAAIGPEVTERERLAPARGHLARALADLPEAARPGVYALSALVWWLCGSQTTANAQLDAALAIAPEHEVSLMVRGLVAVPVVARQLLLPADAGQHSRVSPPRAARS